MLCFKRVEKFLHRPGLSLFRVRQALTNPLLRISESGNVEQVLICASVQHDRRGLSLHGKHHRTLALAKLLHKVARATAKGSERLNVARDVQHWHTPKVRTFLGAIR